MKKNKSLKTLISLVFTSSMLASCGGGSGGDDNDTKEDAIQKIVAYAIDGTNPLPSLQDYIDAGVTGVTSDNLDQLNDVVESLVEEDVDTTEELDALTATLGINIKPTANAGIDKAVQVNQSIQLTGEGIDVDGTIASVQWSKDGTELAATAVYDYTPSSVGTDTLTFTVTDNDGATASDTVEITVTSAPVVNTAPVANAVNASTPENTNKAISLDATDIDGDPLTYSIVTAPAHGSVSISGSVATYTPTANYSGADSFTYKVNDGAVDSNTATVSVNVSNVNAAPTANAGADESVIEGETTPLDASASSDPDADTLTYSWSPSANLNDATLAQPTFTAPAVSSDTPQVYTLTVTDPDGLTDTDTVTVTTLNLPGQPQNAQVVAGDTEATVSWSNVADAGTAYGICYSTVTIANPGACSAAGETLLINQMSPSVVSSLTNGTPYFFVVVPKNINGTGVPSTEVTATPAGVPAVPSPTGKLNDTGLSRCGDYAFGGTGNHSNDENCASANDAGGDPIPVGQDALFGRDVTHPDSSNGRLGFDFTKLDASGVPLVDQTVTYATTPWRCVKDNVTGLIWEVKTTAFGTHFKDNEYTWYNTDTNTNGGDVGTLNAGVNTESFVAQVNATALCGATTWRMPSSHELFSLVDASLIDDPTTPTSDVSIDTDYFPNTNAAGYFTATTRQSSSSSAINILFHSGKTGTFGKNSTRSVRLVRSQ